MLSNVRRTTIWVFSEKIIQQKLSRVILSFDRFDIGPIEIVVPQIIFTDPSWF